jgi:hypothetical protein
MWSPEPPIETLPDGSLLIDARMHLDDASELLGIALESDEFDTLGGYVFGQLGHQPTEGETVRVDGWELRVHAIEGTGFAQCMRRASQNPPKTATTQPKACCGEGNRPQFRSGLPVSSMWRIRATVFSVWHSSMNTCRSKRGSAFRAGALHRAGRRPSSRRRFSRQSGGRGR